MDIKNNQEDRTGNEKLSLGLDISTSVVGVCVLDSNGQLVELFPIKPKGATLFDKAQDSFDQLTRELKLRKNIDKQIQHVFVEENAKMFAVGRTSADVILTLAKMNGILSFLVTRNICSNLHNINVTKARSAIGFKDKKGTGKSAKERLLEENLKKYPSFPWITHIAKTGKSKGQVVYDDCNKDMNDAFVICRGGQLIVL